MSACLLRPALYVLQCINRDLKDASKRRQDGHEEEEVDLDAPPDSLVSTEQLQVDRDLVPVDLRLHSHLSGLARACPCACQVGQGSRELAHLGDLSAQRLEEELARARERQRQSGIMGLDCTNGGTTSTLKKLIFGGRRSESTASASASAAATEEPKKAKAKGEEREQ